MSEQLALPLGGCAQVPRMPPLVLLQMPPQQSVPVEQVSLTCAQNDEFTQTLFEQSFEQQSVFALHALPSSLHEPPLTVRHVPAPPSFWLQRPLQHCAFDVHACVLEMHCERQRLPTQLREQQSVGTVQLCPSGKQVTPEHMLLMQTFEQQSPAFWQD